MNCWRKFRVCRDATRDIEEGVGEILPARTVFGDDSANGFRRNVKSGQFGFLGYTRTEENFLQDAKAVALPQNRYRSSFRVQDGSTTRLQLMWYAIESSM